LDVGRLWSAVARCTPRWSVDEENPGGAAARHGRPRQGGLLLENARSLHFQRPVAANPAPAPQPQLTLGAAPLRAVDHAKYLGIKYSADGSVDKEITARLSAANGAAARLRVFLAAQQGRRAAEADFLQICRDGGAPVWR
jgi:hypothetical protein